MKLLTLTEHIVNKVSLAGEQTHRADRRGIDRHLKQGSLAPATVAHQAKASHWNTLRKEDRVPAYIMKEFERAAVALQEFRCRKHAIKKKKCKRNSYSLPLQNESFERAES